MVLKIIDNRYKVAKFDIKEKLSNKIFDLDFYSITRTDDEISIIVEEKFDLQSNNIELGFRIIKIEGILDFSLVGILSKISKILADNYISIFVISTYNTDYILVKEEDLTKTTELLKENNYSIL